MYKGFLYSFILHLVVIFFISGLFPNFFKRKNTIEIAVDIVSKEDFFIPPPRPEKIKKTSEKKLEPEKEPKEDKIVEKTKKEKAKETKKKEQEKKKEKPIAKKIEAKPSKKAKMPDSGSPDGKKLDDKALAEKQELDAIAKEIARVQEVERERLYREQFIYGNELTPFEKMGVRRQVNFCWQNIAGKIFTKKELEGIKIKILVSLDIDGNVKNARLADAAPEYMDLDNPIYRQIADSALGAFYRCSKIENLPKDKYESWKEFEFIFNPNEIVE